MFVFLKRLFAKEFFKKDIALAVCCALILSVFINLSGFDTKCQKLRNNIFRLHILANSNSEEDQKLKLKVRDALLKAGNGIFETAQNKEEVIKLTEENLQFFKKEAEKVVNEYGKNYPVEVKIEKAYFDTRDYEKFSLPAGEYDSLRVLIGKAEGKNWWCIMFPAMCIPAAGNVQNIENVTDKATAEITENKSKYKIKFKAVEIYESFKSKISKHIS